MNKKSIIPFIDVLFSFLLIFICVVMLVRSPKISEDALQQQAVYQIVLVWDGALKSDIDLWAEDPQARLVGFNRREGGDGSLFSLNRDDLGNRTEVQDGKTIEINEEIISFRGTYDGEYVVNGHLYNAGDPLPIKATAKLVKVKPYKEIIKTEREFSAVGDEQTFFRFKIEKGNVVETGELPKIIVQQGDGQ